MQMLNAGWEIVIKMEKEYNRTIMRPSAGIKLPLNREMQKLNAGWEIVIIMEKE
jgi:hypothetical protein